MDITLDNKKRTANKFINGETVNYAVFYLLSFIVLIAVKQILKIVFGVESNIASGIGFLIAEITLFIFQRQLIFIKASISSTGRQLIFSALKAAVHFGIFKATSFLLGNIAGMQIFTVWLCSAVIIFTIDYPASRYLVFECISSAENNKNGRIYKLVFRNRFILLSMALAAVSMAFIYMVYSVFPFGDTTVLRMDLYHQYGPLFVELFDRVTNLQSFIYSWTSGGGSSFLGNFFNYLSSPLNALIFLFDRNQMPYAISFLVLVKGMLAAAAFAIYLKFSQKRHSYVTAAFGVLYSFSAYMLAYFWNIMWLDGMIVLPLIVLGIERIVDTGRCRLYILSLIYILYSSYYIGYMTCIFSVIYFIAYFIMKANVIKIKSKPAASGKFSFKALINNVFINRGLKFALSSLVAGALCAVILIPVYYILSGCSATSDSFPSEAQSYFTVLDFIQSHIAGLETTIRSSGDDVLPNIYCGAITLLLVPLFIVNRKISLREKAVYSALLIFLFASFNLNYLNFIWHALHFPNDLPYRFSYMYSFVLLVVAFKAIKHIKELNIREIGITAFSWIALLAIFQELPTNKITDFTIYTSIAFIIIWTGVLFLIKKGNTAKLVAGVLITAITFCEIIVCDTNAFGFNQKLRYYNANYDTYVDTINYLKEADDTFYRTELCRLNTRMDPCLYGYSGISTFSSMAYEDYSGLQYSLGMYGNRINSYTYNTQTAVYNLMYGIKYLIYNGEEVKPSTDLYTRYYISSDNGATVYSNDYTLPIAYCVNSAIEMWNTAEGNPFQIQQDFFTLATGFQNVFTQAQFVSTSYDGIFGETADECGTYWITKSDDENYGEVTIVLRAAEDGNFYLYVTSPDITNISCTYGEETISQSIDTPYILDLGFANAGDEITVSLDASSISSGSSNFEIYAYSLNKAVFTAGYNSLLGKSMEITEYSDSHIKGSVTADANCVLYSSIPYDDGWSVYVDGIKTDTFEIAECQLGVMLKPGEHTVEYKYHPKGVSAGSGITAGTLVILAGYTALKRKKKHKKSCNF